MAAQLETDKTGSIKDRTNAYASRKSEKHPLYSTLPSGHAADAKPTGFQNVIQGTFKVSSSGLFTSGLGTCTALSFTYDGRYFVAHVDDSSSPKILADVISSNFDIAKLKNDDKFKVHIFSGALDTRHSFAITAEALQILGLEKQSDHVKNVIFNENVGTAHFGAFREKPKLTPRP